MKSKSLRHGLNIVIAKVTECPRVIKPLIKYETVYLYISAPSQINSIVHMQHFTRGIDVRPSLRMYKTSSAIWTTISIII